MLAVTPVVDKVVAKLPTPVPVRSPDNEILDEELLPGFDNKLRYPDGLRHGMYKFLLGAFKRYSKKIPIYLCMEEISMWQGLRQNLDRSKGPGRALVLADTTANT